MSRFNISLKNGNYNEETGYIITYEEYHNTLEIICDNIEDNNSFTMTYYGDEGIVVNRDRCKLDVYIEKNTKPFDKEFTIICTHANDAEVFITINITQSAEIFSVTPQETDITLPSIIKAHYMNANGDIISQEEYNRKEETEKEEYKLLKEGNNIYFLYKKIDINVVGGSQRYRIVDIARYHIIDYDEYEQPITRRYNFDNGFILNHNDTNILIKCYGRTFMDSNDYYIIKIQHYDTRDIEAEIKIKYDNETNVGQRIKIKQKENLVPQISQLYMPIQRIASTEEISIAKETENYKMEFENDIDSYIIYNDTPMTELTFNVTLNEEPCDLSTNSLSIGTWCSTEINEYYNDEEEIVRKLIIKIKDCPISERTCIIKVYIIDKPNIYKTLTLTNKPSLP